jgi:acyl-CoA dehydrogenase
VTELFPEPYVWARDRYRVFMDEHVYTNEAAIEREDDAALELLEALRGRAREAGLWARHVPPEAGGTGLGVLYYACLNEEIGRSTYA